MRRSFPHQSVPVLPLVSPVRGSVSESCSPANSLHGSDEPERRVRDLATRLQDRVVNGRHCARWNFARIQIRRATTSRSGRIWRLWRSTNSPSMDPNDRGVHRLRLCLHLGHSVSCCPTEKDDSGFSASEAALMFSLVGIAAAFGGVALGALVRSRLVGESL